MRPSAGETLPQTSWLSAFSVRDGIVHYHQTGARIRLNAALLRDVLTWSTYYLPLRLKAAFRRLFRPGPRLFFVPRAPPPWYLLWNASAWIGARDTDRPEEADAVVYFEDATWGGGATSVVTPCINGRCTDVSKSRVTEVFEEVFGYPLAIDPETHTGPAVEKSELNGAHDGSVIECPQPRRAGYVYQRLIETGEGDFVEDLRAPCVAGKLVTVFIKRRLRVHRFANANASVRLAEPGALFSQSELDQIEEFARAMKLDWGGLDILRDRASGQIYIVDVNKTDMPPLALSFRDKMRSSQKLGQALEAMIESYAA